MKINETNYIKQLQLHNEKALLYVIKTYGGLLRSIVSKHLYALPASQEECLNDIFYAIWKNISSFKEEKSTFKNWIAGIARYKSVDYLRKHLKEIKCSISLDEWYLEKESQAVHGETKCFARQEFLDQMEDILTCLKSSDQDLFLKLFFEEKDLEEISKDTGIKKDILYNRISRAKKRIRKHYNEGKGYTL